MISASYFDGASARLFPVDLDLGHGVLGLAGADLVKSYPFADARMAEPFSKSPCVIDFADGARCEVTDAAGKAELTAALGYRQSRVMRLQQYWYGALLALVLLVASLAAFVQYGLPALSERVVASLPAAADQRVGDEAMRALDGHLFTPSRLSDQRIAQVEDIFLSILPPRTRIPIHLKVVNMAGRPPNAFALPNGTVVMTDQMILHILDHEHEFDDDMRAALAGVLAHEIGHVEGRHSMRAIVRSSTLALGSAALFGDFSNVVAGAPVLLMNMDYSRSMEAAADDYAIVRMHEAGMSTEPLADLFDSLERLAPGQSSLPKWMNKNFSYLSSHPVTADRSARFRGEKPVDD